MIKLLIKEKIDEMGKSLLEVARDTGLNRNTINDLYHNNVKGINFDTLEKFCGAYDLRVEDLVVFDPEVEYFSEYSSKDMNIVNCYKQEGSLIPFTAIIPFLFGYKFFDREVDMGTCLIYFKNDYGEVYWDKDKMEESAILIYKKFETKKSVDNLFKRYIPCAKSLKDIFDNFDESFIVKIPKKKVEELLGKILRIYKSFWETSLFIDLFDSGVDMRQIKKLQTEFQLSDTEVQLLCTPHVMNFSNERDLLIYKYILREMEKYKGDKKKLIDMVATSKTLDQIYKDYIYVSSNYSSIPENTKHTFLNEVLEIIKNVNLKNKIKEIENATKKIRKEKLLILRKHKLSENPFYFFEKLTEWREHRKQYNLMGIHLLHYILKSVEVKSGIPYRILKYMTHDELSSVIYGLQNKGFLQKRQEGCMVLVNKGSYKMLIGEEALSLKKEGESKITTQTTTNTISGRVASQGYARGVARIILDEKDFGKFKEGEVLVTGMTRPEFVPLMKMSSAIVTNEGGITCHAAIVSRELGKPCIIGTQHATSFIKDGDLVEVRANHGTVRILN